MRELAEVCGFEVHGWLDKDLPSVVVQTPRDTTEVGIRTHRAANRPVVNYIGTREEALAFMTAWSQCAGHKVAELMRDEINSAKIRSTIVQLGTDRLVEPNQVVQLTARPQRGAFRGERVAIPHEIAKRFSVCDLKVGNQSTFEVTGDIPAVVFAINVETQAAWFDLGMRANEIAVEMTRPAKESFGRVWSMPVTQLAMDLVVVAVNTSDEPWRFCALVLGRSAYNW